MASRPSDIFRKLSLHGTYMDPNEISSPEFALHWKHTNKNTSPHFTEVIDPKGWFRAKLWADGSVSVIAYQDKPHLEADDDSIYASSTGIKVNDLDDLINRLTSLKSLQSECFEKLE